MGSRPRGGGGLAGGPPGEALRLEPLLEPVPGQRVIAVARDLPVAVPGVEGPRLDEVTARIQPDHRRAVRAGALLGRREQQGRDARPARPGPDEQPGQLPRARIQPAQPDAADRAG